MEDAFAIFSLPRRAALDAAELQRGYAELSRAAHPDHGGSESRAASVNAAFQTLSAPERRLRHLLDLAAPPEAKAWRTVPLDGGMMELFSELGQALADSSSLLEKRERASSALAKALLAHEAMLQRERLEAIGFRLEAKREELEQALPSLDTQLSAADAGTWKNIAAVQARFAYVAKWQSQVRERLLALM